MADIQQFANNATSTLSIGVGTGDTTLVLADASGFPSLETWHQCKATLWDGDAAFEIVDVTAISGNNLTVVRAAESTTAVAWAAGTSVKLRLTAGVLDTFAQGFDNTGNARGTDAVDLQSSRSAATEVASQTRAIAVGNDITAAGIDGIYLGSSVSGSNNAYQILIGFEAVGTVQGATGYGYRVSVTGQDACGFGVYANASASGATALGDRSVADVAKTTNISGPICVRNDSGEGDLFKYFAGAEVVLFTDEVDLTATADDVATITVSSGATFYPDECGIIVTSADTVTGQPNVEFGVTGTTDQLLTATATTGDAAGERDRYASLATDNGQTTLTLSVETGATATTLLGRGYFKGILVEDE